MASSVISWTSWTTGARVPVRREIESSMRRSSALAFSCISLSTMGIPVRGSVITFPWSTFTGGFAIMPRQTRFWRAREFSCVWRIASTASTGTAAMARFTLSCAVEIEQSISLAISSYVKPCERSSAALVSMSICSKAKCGLFLPRSPTLLIPFTIPRGGERSLGMPRPSRTEASRGLS